MNEILIPHLHMTQADVEKFYDKAHIPLLQGEDTCWEWMGGIGSHGYGNYCHNAEKYLAHRLSWMIERERAIPAGHVVRHACDNPVCIRPDHLMLGTPADNMRDKVERGRHVNGAMAGNWRKVMTPYKVLDVYTLHLEYGLSHLAISQIHDVTRMTITQLVNGDSWSHLYPHYLSLKKRIARRKNRAPKLNLNLLEKR